jgi:molecular chaperone HtpG
MKTDTQFKAGMYLLETLTSGMYNDPLSIYREYIQNSVDAIDTSSSKESKSVHITIDPFIRSITIFDNGSGIPIKNAASILSGIGNSNKAGTDLRGFRGIGRLGGIAFSDNVSFRTKSENDNAEIIQKWDCIKLRNLLSNPKNSSMPLQELFDQITTIEKNKSIDISKSYFEVKLEGVSSFRNYLFDIKKIREYISKVCPVDYSPETFTFRKEINKYLKSNVKAYNSYPVYLNGKQIYKPYNDNVKVTKSGFDKIEDIEYLTIKDYDDIFAYGWIGKRQEFLGSINKGDDSSGIQVRSGNILLGDSHLLDRCFKEERFNSYMVGELHIVHPELIPNSRRDGFVDNDLKSRFFDAVEKEIGLPMSKEIRNRSKQTNSSSDYNLVRVKEIIGANPSNEQFESGILHIRNLKYTTLIQNQTKDIFNKCKDCNHFEELSKQLFINKNT